MAANQSTVVNLTVWRSLYTPSGSYYLLLDEVSSGSEYIILTPDNAVESKGQWAMEKKWSTSREVTSGSSAVVNLLDWNI